MNESPSVRLAMWSGPRNISTAMMRSWESRSDTFVVDEPLYAHYLTVTEVDHPGRDEIIARYESDWRRVVAWLTGPVPEGKAVFFQKHMAHHLLPGIERDWVMGVTNAFLIRDPREMLLSLHKVTPHPAVEDTGLPQQWEIFEMVRDHLGSNPPVLDARDVLESPGPLLERLCLEVNVEFDEAMLSWKPGPRESDGIWAKHWYESVEKSTCFQPYTPRDETLPEALRPVWERCQEFYDKLHAVRLKA